MKEGQKVRCKFVCVSVQDNKPQGQDAPTFGANFQVVYGGSDENEKFYASTPTGNLSLNGMKEQHFKSGDEFYLDLIRAPAKATS